MHDIQGSRVLITGAAVRLGRELALAFARAGARIIVHYNRNAAAAAELLEALERFGPGHVCLQADLRSAGDLLRLAEAAFRGPAPATGLINNASVYRRTRLRDSTPQRLLEDFTINFFAPFELMRLFARYGERGWIINVLDQRVAGADPGAGGYALAKKALRDATEAAAIEWGPLIRVNAVAPGFVLPPPGVAPGRMEPLVQKTPLRRPAALDDLAGACLYLARAETVTGHVLFVDAGAHLPRPGVEERSPRPAPENP